MKKLIVGLGNPGNKYQNTRHNLGFLVLDKMLRKDGWKKNKKAKALLKCKNDIIFVKPQNFMNDSGVSVAYLAKAKNVKPNDILIVRDDIDLKLGIIRTSTNSTSSGHKGVRSILQALKVKEIPQIKVGIDQDRTVDLDDYVIGKFSSKEKRILPKILDLSVNLVLKFISSPTDDKVGEFENTTINVGVR